MFQQTSAGAMVPGGAWPSGEWQGWGQTAADPQGLLERDRLAQLGRALLTSGQGSDVPGWAVAHDAVQVEEQARQAMDEAQKRAQDWLDRNRPADRRTHPLLSAALAEAVTAHREAEQVAQRTLAELGRVAERVAAARQVLENAPQRRTAAEQAYHAALQAVDQDTAAARQELRAMGLDR